MDSNGRLNPMRSRLSAAAMEWAENISTLGIKLVGEVARLGLSLTRRTRLNPRQSRKKRLSHDFRLSWRRQGNILENHIFRAQVRTLRVVAVHPKGPGSRWSTLWSALTVGRSSS